MILLVAVICGLLTGWGWARSHGKPYHPPALRSIWLIPVGFIPQLFVAYLPATHTLMPERLAALSLWASLFVFLAFVWINRRLPGMLVLLTGLTLNLLVMGANGGWMPISPENASRILGEDVTQYLALGSRFGQKDVLMRISEMHLGFLSDRFLLPTWSPYQAVFSAGDILIAAGVFWLLAKPPADDKTLQAE